MKRSSCSVENFVAKFLNVIFTPEELVNQNCIGTRGKERLDDGKLGLLKKYVLIYFFIKVVKLFVYT